MGLGDVLIKTAMSMRVNGYTQRAAALALGCCPKTLQRAGLAGGWGQKEWPEAWYAAMAVPLEEQANLKGMAEGVAQMVTHCPRLTVEQLRVAFPHISERRLNKWRLWVVRRLKIGGKVAGELVKMAAGSAKSTTGMDKIDRGPYSQ